MPDFVWNIGFAISLAFVSSFCLLIARRIFRSGVEYFSSRILILFGITNTCLCGLLFLSQGTHEAIRIATSGPIHPSQLLIPIIFITVPLRILWNYFLIQRKLVARYSLKPCETGKIVAEIATLCKTMGINPPTIKYSNLIVSPFVFGRRSSRAILSIPEQWLNANSSHRHIQTLHELSHIRNHDVGFLTWSDASLRDLRLLLLLLPALAIYCFALGYNHVIPSILLYLICSLILFTMLRYIVRKRESLADLTAAMLVKSGKVKDVITSQETYTATPDITSGQQTKPMLTDKIHRWLSDKAMFSKKQKPWKLMLQIFNFFNSLHPSRSERLKKISSDEIMAMPKLPIIDSFWAGIAIGLMGVVIGLGGFWFSTSFQHHQEDIDYLRFSFMALGIAAPIAIGYLAVFLALPVWSSLKLPRLNNRFILLLLSRYGVALAGTSIVCPVVLTAGATNTQVLTLLTICLIWGVIIAGFGFCINIVIISLWITMRYLQSSHSAELKKTIWTFGLFIIAVFSLIIIGSEMIDNEMVFSGANVIFSTLAGGALVSRVIRDSRFSETEQYLILHLHGLIYRFEGKWFRTFAWIIHSLYITVLLFIFATLIYLATDLVLGNLFQNLDSTVGILIAIVISCTVLVVLERKNIKRISKNKSSKINILYRCLNILSATPDTTTRKKINEVIKSYDLKIKSRNRNLNLTMHDAYEIIAIIRDDSIQRITLDPVLMWVLRCQTESGFGLWPQSTPRLSSTYQALSILNDANRLDAVNSSEHVSWIKSLQQQDGSFKSPWSKRKVWEDTFFAVKSLNILGASLETNGTDRCCQPCHRILQEGITQDQPEKIYYSVAALNALGTLNDDTIKMTSDWLCHKIEKLLLTNIGLNYEAIHFTVMAYNIVNQSTPLLSMAPQIQLLTNRIQMALDAELEDIRA